MLAQVDEMLINFGFKARHPLYVAAYWPDTDKVNDASVDDVARIPVDDVARIPVDDVARISG